MPYAPHYAFSTHPPLPLHPKVPCPWALDTYSMVCDRICENPALPTNIDFALEAFIVTEVGFQQKRDYCMNGSTGP